MRPDGRRTARGALAALLLLCAAAPLLFAPGAAAQSLPDDFLNSLGSIEASAKDPLWSDWDGAANEAEALSRMAEPDEAAVAEARETLAAQRDGAQRISAAVAAEIERLNKELLALGPAPEEGVKEPADIAKLRGDLQQRIAAARGLQGRADQVAARADGLLSALAAVARRGFVERLAAGGPSPALPDAWARAADAVGRVAGRVEREVGAFLSTPSEQARLRERGPVAAAAIVIALAIGLGLRNLLLLLLKRAAAGPSRGGRRILVGFGAVLARLLTVSAALVAAASGVAVLEIGGVAGPALLSGLGTGLAACVVVYALAAAFFSPGVAETRLVGFSDAEALRGYRAALVIGLAYLIDRVGEALAKVAAAPAADPEVSAVSVFLAVGCGGLALWRLSSATRPEAPPKEGEGQFSLVVRRAFLVIACVAPALALAGYAYAAQFLYFSFVETLGVLVFLWLIYRVVESAVDLYLASHRAAAEGAPPGGGERLRLLPLLAGFLLACAAAPVLALVWGADPADLAAAWRGLAAGLVIGDVVISPVDFVIFAAVFAIGYALVRAAQTWLREIVLPKTGMTVGGAEALSAGFGYLGVSIAAVIGVSAAGIDLSSLALVVGALSVGIGLGLQGVVNNFVSGIILLIERPVKVGDWIDVGGVNGYVSKVNVRSTEIETFDRSTYVLPNSSLISGPVTNYTHHNNVGRLIIKVGVAYGTDTRKVEKILREIGESHPLILPFPQPAALFMGFGDSALDFELRVMLRDVNSILVVRSELNHRVAERFREEGIEIPFPQRDLNLRGLGPLEAALDRLRAAPGGPKDAPPEA